MSKVGDTVKIQGKEFRLAECFQCKRPIAFIDTGKTKEDGKKIYEKVNADGTKHEDQRPPRRLSFWVGMSIETGGETLNKKTYTMSKEAYEGTEPQRTFDEVEAELQKKIARDSVHKST